MSYKPIYTITPVLLAQVEQIAGLRERILAAAVQVPWIPALQKDTRIRNAHSSTAIEGNPLTLEQVRAIEEGREIPATAQRARREVANYFAGLRFVEKNAQRSAVTHAEMLKLHRIMAGEVMDQGRAGRYRTIRVRVGSHVAPPPEQVQPMMSELLQWWNIHAARISPIVSSAIVHHQFETIHPFADGNGRTARGCRSVAAIHRLRCVRRIARRISTRWSAARLPRIWSPFRPSCTSGWTRPWGNS